MLKLSRIVLALITLLGLFSCAKDSVVETKEVSYRIDSLLVNFSLQEVWPYNGHYSKETVFIPFGQSLKVLRLHWESKKQDTLVVSKFAYSGHCDVNTLGIHDYDGDTLSVGESGWFYHQLYSLSGGKALKHYYLIDTLINSRRARETDSILGVYRSEVDHVKRFGQSFFYPLQIPIARENRTELFPKPAAALFDERAGKVYTFGSTPTSLVGTSCTWNLSTFGTYSPKDSLVLLGRSYSPKFYVYNLRGNIIDSSDVPSFDSWLPNFIAKDTLKKYGAYSPYLLSKTANVFASMQYLPKIERYFVFNKGYSANHGIYLYDKSYHFVQFIPLPNSWKIINADPYTSTVVCWRKNDNAMRKIYRVKLTK